MKKGDVFLTRLHLPGHLYTEVRVVNVSPTGKYVRVVSDFPSTEPTWITRQSLEQIIIEELR